MNSFNPAKKVRGGWTTYRQNLEEAVASGTIVIPEAKWCGGCKQTRPLQDFNLRNHNESKPRSRCKECSYLHSQEYNARPDVASRRKERQMSVAVQDRTNKYRVRNWEQYMFTSARSAAKARGIPFILESKQVIENLWEQQNGRCYWFGIPMEPSSLPKHPSKPSLDRLDGDLGYEPNNLVLCCVAANLGRNNVSVDAWLNFCNKIRGQRLDNGSPTI